MGFAVKNEESGRSIKIRDKEILDKRDAKFQPPINADERRSSQDVQSLPGVTRNRFICGDKNQVLDHGLSDQHPVKGVLMYGR